MGERESGRVRKGGEKVSGGDIDRGSGEGDRGRRALVREIQRERERRVVVERETRGRERERREERLLEK